ncbi:hypothetical protein PC2016_3636 [Pseudoalteromonas carrageenovora]|uniref:Uncharacterized protein n=1 Tax=Pseudoalteromonas carrageenovora IAM 12662 TaxID=1314868 RepID=A0A2K4XEK7_PSEVC|nr:hypothetical protein [Pseudoalteromonas carrageenovora]MBE0384350.1 hypothetical protein [Pseudoalteromonas carrageenovora IAM 12662]QBJ73808.1 hypothetical protein PC2016_3636 [Pseudoalteromonas carrageenovora]SOU42735.1 conserved protein of unknown function [Pseudoalteromonas carrageenovora IAM 12662]
MSLIRIVQSVGLSGFNSLTDVEAVQTVLNKSQRLISLTQALICVLLLSVSHTAFASECLNIKVTKPIKVDDKTGLLQSLKYEQVKLLHKDKSGICLPTRDTYILSFSEGIPFIVTRLKGHTPEITLLEKDKNYYALIKFYAGNKLQILKGYQVINSELYALPNFTLSSNVSNISIDEGVISVKNTKLVEEHSIDSVTLYNFDLSGVSVRH